MLALQRPVEGACGHLDEKAGKAIGVLRMGEVSRPRKDLDPGMGNGARHHVGVGARQHGVAVTPHDQDGDVTDAVQSFGAIDLLAPNIDDTSQCVEK